MNVLAHLHLASLSGSSIIGNAAADFVKGDPYRQYSALIADGIMMHRRLDKLIDQLPEVRQCKSLFRPETLRMAPITLDIVWDHFLSKHWQNYVQGYSVATFDQQTKAIIMKYIALFPKKFYYFMQYLWQGEWLVNYADINFIGRVLNGMASSRSKLAALRETFTDFTDNYASLETSFLYFYPQLMLKAKSCQL